MLDFCTVSEAVLPTIMRKTNPKSPLLGGTFYWKTLADLAVLLGSCFRRDGEYWVSCTVSNPPSQGEMKGAREANLPIFTPKNRHTTALMMAEADNANNTNGSID